MLCNTCEADREVKKDWNRQHNKADDIRKVDAAAV